MAFPLVFEEWVHTIEVVDAGPSADGSVELRSVVAGVVRNRSSNAASYHLPTPSARTADASITGLQVFIGTSNSPLSLEDLESLTPVRDLTGTAGGPPLVEIVIPAAQTRGVRVSLSVKLAEPGPYAIKPRLPSLSQRVVIEDLPASIRPTFTFDHPAAFAPRGRASQVLLQSSREDDAGTIWSAEIASYAAPGDGIEVVWSPEPTPRP